MWNSFATTVQYAGEMPGPGGALECVRHGPGADAHQRLRGVHRRPIRDKQTVDLRSAASVRSRSKSRVLRQILGGAELQGFTKMLITTRSARCFARSTSCR